MTDLAAAADTTDQPEPGPAARTAAATVTIYPDGPLVVRGDFAVREVDGSPVATPRVVALCRCGRSAVKPLCDGSHKRGFVGGTKP